MTTDQGAAELTMSHKAPEPPVEGSPGSTSTPPVLEAPIPGTTGPPSTNHQVDQTGARDSPAGAKDVNVSVARPGSPQGAQASGQGSQTTPMPVVPPAATSPPSTTHQSENGPSPTQDLPSQTPPSNTFGGALPQVSKPLPDSTQHTTGPLQPPPPPPSTLQRNEEKEHPGEGTSDQASASTTQASQPTERAKIQSGKTIVLCFDGTSSQSDIGVTNVWKLIGALERGKPDKQIFHYLKDIETNVEPPNSPGKFGNLFLKLPDRTMDTHFKAR